MVVGNSGLRNNTGFTGINEATGTTIQDGKELTLIGGKSDGSGNRFNLAEKVISAVGDGAKLILAVSALRILPLSGSGRRGQPVQRRRIEDHCR